MHHGDCLEVLPTIPDQSVDAVITDPPYPEIKRAYGKMSVPDWWDMMMVVCKETRRILKPMGSAVFILQPNSEHVGQVRGWLWEFMAWVCREWNMVQDVWWWKHTTLPTVHCHRTRGLMRPSVKSMAWCGPPHCYRDQDSVLWGESEGNRVANLEDRMLQYKPSGISMRNGRCSAAAKERGGVTPFNLLPLANTNSQSGAGAHGHGAGTPLKLADWWTRYICPPGGVVADWFMGSATMGVAAIQNGCDFIGIEKFPVSEREINPKDNPDYFSVAQRRTESAQNEMCQLELE